MTRRRLAFLGAGAVGAPAALMAAEAMPDAEVTVLDAGLPAKAMRTFVLLCGTCDQWQDSGMWEHIAKRAHRIDEVVNDFEGNFGLLRLSADDCCADAIGYSIAEADFLGAMRSALHRRDNISFCDQASVARIEPNGTVSWSAAGQETTASFDAIGVAGLPAPLLTQAGFRFSEREYNHTAVVSTHASSSVFHRAYERLLPHGAATTVPRKDGWAHILLAGRDTGDKLAACDDAGYARELARLGLCPETPASKIVFKGAFRPRQRMAAAAGIGRIALLGATACTVHPIGAQELNLGLQDGLRYAEAIAASEDEELAESGPAFAASRLADRRRIATGTDLAARFLDLDCPGKLAACGLAATAAGLLPLARRAILANFVLQRN